MYDASIIQAFMYDNAVFLSLPAMGNRIAELYPLADAEKRMVTNFEEEHSAVAYHVIRNEIETGITYSTIYSILYVSDKEKEWGTECNGFKDFSSAYIAYPMVYTWDAGRAERDTDDLSAGTGNFCAITVTVGCGGLCSIGANLRKKCLKYRLSRVFIKKRYENKKIHDKFFF